jgi:hypothetical protein
MVERCLTNSKCPQAATRLLRQTADSYLWLYPLSQSASDAPICQQLLASVKLNSLSPDFTVTQTSMGTMNLLGAGLPTSSALPSPAPS